MYLLFKKFYRRLKFLKIVKDLDVEQMYRHSSTELLYKYFHENIYSTMPNCVFRGDHSPFLKGLFFNINWH